ncbi:MAG: translation initiation factor [Candidatus Hydrogenedens sp.]|nr:translation initiation factor [Candidatus Hydrogenedens sp.]
MTDNPFAALAPQRDALPAGPAPEPKEPAQQAEAWRVARTRKGGWPLRLEKRSGGKVVTVLSQVTAGRDALLAALKKHCASGGRMTDDGLELQGDHVAKAAAFLDRQ